MNLTLFCRLLKVEIAGLNSIIDSGVTETMAQDTQVIFFANVLLYLGVSSESLRDVSPFATF